jgi:hypothetical protein
MGISAGDCFEAYDIIKLLVGIIVFGARKHLSKWTYNRKDLFCCV